MRLSDRPYNLFLLTAIVFFIAVLYSFNLGIDLEFHDTYSFIPLALLIWLPIIVSILFWLFYLLTNRFLFSKTLTWIHIILTIVCSILILVLPFLLTNIVVGVDIRRHYNDYGGSNRFKVFGNLIRINYITILILLLGQVIYFINLILGIAKKAAR